MCFCNVSSELCFASIASSHVPWVKLQTATFLVSPISFSCVGGSPCKYPQNDLVVLQIFLSHEAHKQIAVVWEPSYRDRCLSLVLLLYTRPALALPVFSCGLMPCANTELCKQLRVGSARAGASWSRANRGDAITEQGISSGTAPCERSSVQGTGLGHHLQPSTRLGL